MDLPPRRRYFSDPIQEALCEFQFRAPATGWTVLPGLLYEKLRETYPLDPVPQGPNVPTLKDVDGPQPLPGLPAIQIAVGPVPMSRIRLANQEENKLVLVSPFSISVNCLHPYEGWEQFFQRIRQVLRAFAELATEGFDVQRIGLRYINRVDADLADLDKYFGIRPVSFPGMPLRLGSFICRSELPATDRDDRLVIATFASLVAPANSLILDIDAIAQNLARITTLDAVVEVVKEVRILEKTAFEASITEEARTGPFGGFEEIPDA